MFQWKSNEVHTEIGPLACSLPLKVCAIIIIRWVDWVVGGSSFHPGPGSCTVQNLSLAKTLQRYPDQIFGVSMPFVGQCLPHHTDTGVKRPRIVFVRWCKDHAGTNLWPDTANHELLRQMLACLPSILSSRCGRVRMCSEHLESLQVPGCSNSFGTCPERSPGAFLG